MQAAELKALVQETISEALGCQIDDDTDFFDAGGDSEAAEKVLVSLSKALSLNLPGWLLLDHPSPSELTAALVAKLAQQG